MMEEVKFAYESLLEEDVFELPVPPKTGGFSEQASSTPPAGKTSRNRRHRRAEPQEHRPAAACLPHCPLVDDRAADHPADRIAASRQAVDRGPALRQYERRSRARILRRRH